MTEHKKPPANEGRAWRLIARVYSLRDRLSPSTRDSLLVELRQRRQELQELDTYARRRIAVARWARELRAQGRTE